MWGCKPTSHCKFTSFLSNDVLVTQPNPSFTTFNSNKAKADRPKRLGLSIFPLGYWVQPNSTNFVLDKWSWSNTWCQQRCKEQ